MRWLKVFFLCFLCLFSLTSCSSYNDSNTLWIPIDDLSWGMEKEELIILLEDKGIDLQEEKGTVPNRYILSKIYTCWGVKGTVKIDFKSFSGNDTAFLTSFVFYPEEFEEKVLIKNLTRAFDVDGTIPPDNLIQGLQWDSKMTLSDISDKVVKEKREVLIESIWINIPFHETSEEMLRPLVTARYTPSESNNSSSIYLSGERAAVAALAEEN